MYFDIESNQIVTREQLFTEYQAMKENYPEEYAYTFPEYIKNCLTSSNGTLELIKSGKGER